tara:strand:- start:1839 stop:2057 length:219 start_codon:yes stop_codon:yes gene_type:complete
MKQYEIIKKQYTATIWDKPSVGYFIKDDFAILNGPYKTLEDAKKDVPKGQLQYPLDLGIDNEVVKLFQEEPE